MNVFINEYIHFLVEGGNIINSLRESKKQRTKKEILEAAERIFLQDGYEYTTVSKIAEKALVGTGTIYNYFKSKADLFVAVVIGEQQKTDYNALLSKADLESLTPYEAIEELINLGLKSMENIPKKLWKEIIKAIFNNVDDKNVIIDQLFRFDKEFIDSLEYIFLFYKDKGIINDKFNARDASECIYNIMIGESIQFMMFESLSYESVTKNIKRLIQFVFRDKL